MQINFKDGSYLEFKTNQDGLYIITSGKKSDGTFTSSSAFLTKSDAINLMKFLIDWLDN